MRSFSTILFDAYGVFWNGKSFYEGSLETMKRLREDGVEVGVISNTTETNLQAIKKYHERGLIHGVHYDILQTSGQTTKSIIEKEALPFETPNKTYYVYGLPRHTIFEDSRYRQVEAPKEADFIYIGVPKDKDGNDRTDMSAFIPEIERLGQYDLPWVCSNPDYAALEGNPPVYVTRQGSIAKYVEEELGGKVTWFGKPDVQILKDCLAQRTKDHSLDNIALVGDTLRTDILCALRASEETEYNVTPIHIIGTGMTKDQMLDGISLNSIYEEYRVEMREVIRINMISDLNPDSVNNLNLVY